jgi:NitT/TauT family transport system substrate-binding protein
MTATMRKLFAGVLGAVLLAGVAPHAQAQTTAIPVTVLTSPADSAAEIYIGKDLGIFAKHGLDVDIEPGTNGSAIAAAVAGNAVDIGYSDLVTLAKGYLKGIPFVAIAPAAIWTSTAPVAGLVVLVNSPITSAKDLAGKVIAVPGLGTLAEYSPRAWIDQNGGDSTTAKFTEMPYPTMPAALTAGRIDVAYISEPFLALVKKDVRVLGYSHNAIAKQFLQSAWFTTPQWAKDHPDAVRRFAAAMRETAIWANQKANLPKSAEILAKYTKIDIATIAVMERARFAETLTAASIQPAIDVTAKYGKFEPFPADRLIYHAN